MRTSGRPSLRNISVINPAPALWRCSSHNSCSVTPGRRTRGGPGRTPAAADDHRWQPSAAGRASTSVPRPSDPPAAARQGGCGVRARCSPGRPWHSSRDWWRSCDWTCRRPPRGAALAITWNLLLFGLDPLDARARTWQSKASKGKLGPATGALRTGSCAAYGMGVLTLPLSLRLCRSE
jgi:hypothetical protein